MKKSILLILLMALLAPWTGLKAEDLTVHDGTVESSNTPMYVGYFDDFTRTQVVFPASELEEMAGGTITSLKWYTKSDNIPYTTLSQVDIYLKEVNYTTVSAFEDKSSATMVYQGTLSFVTDGSGGSVTITFSTPFEYNEGNLLVGCDNTTDAGYKFIYFNGETVTGASIGGYNGSSLSQVTATQRNFLPKTTFTYEPAATGSCPKPKSLSFSNIAARAADLSWDGATAAAWQICINDDEENLIDVSSASYSFANLTPLTAYSVKVRAVCGEEQSDWSAAKSFTTLSACPYPITNLLISDLYTNSAIINFDGEAGAFEAELSTDSNFPEGSTTFYSAESEAFGLGDITFEGLIPATKYYVRMRAYCEDELSSGEWSSVFSFTTACEPVSAINENFEGITAGSGVLPTCWTRINKATSASYADYPEVYNSSAEALTGNNSLRFYTYDGSSIADEYAVLPEMDNLNGKRIVFYAKQNNSATLQVGTIDDPTKDDFIFTPLGENIALTSAYKKFIVNLVNLESDDKFIAFKLAKPSGYSYIITVHIDSIIVEDIPSCLEISDLAFVSATTNSATLNWSASESGESAWDIYYSTENVAPTAETVPQVVAATAKAIPNGLNASSTYYVWVRAHCLEDHGAWSDPISFKTECEAISAFPYSENFDSYIGSSSESAPSSYPNDELPQCWSFLNRASSNSTYPQAFISSKSGYVVSGNCLFFKSSSTTPLYAILPQFAEEISALKLLFTYRNEGVTDYNGTLYAGYMTNPADASTFVPVLTCNRTTALTEKEVLFGGAPAGSYIAFKYEGGTNNNYYLSIDNVSVLLAPTCTKPASIAEPSDITSSSASFSWTAGDANTPDYEYVIVAKDSTPDWSLAVEVNGATSVVVNEGLAANTAYDFYVRGNCGDAALQKSDALHISFRTACAPYEAASFTEDFEDGIYCWTVGNLQSDALQSDAYTPEVGSAYKHGSEGNGLELEAYYYMAGAYSGSEAITADSAYAILPQMNYGEKSLKDFSISLYAKSFGTNANYNKHLILGVVADPADKLASFDSITDFELSDSFSLYEYSFANYEGDKPYIVLLATHPKNYAGTNCSGHFYVDDIALFETPSCQPLRSISISDLARRSMVVNLEPKAGIALASEYELVYSTEELDEAALEAADKIAINDTNAYEISGLDRETLYYIYVRANCGGENGKSAWVSTSAKTKALAYCEGDVIGNGTATAKYPFTNYNYSYTQTIYTADNFDNAEGVINSLYLQRASGSAAMNNIKIYLGTTSKSAFSSNTDWIAESDLTLVFNGSIAACGTEPGEDEIIFDTPFAYDGQSNLVLAISNAVGTYSNIHSYYYTTVSNTFLHRQDDNTSSYANYPSVAGTRDGYRANVRFSLCSALPTCPSVSELNASVLGTGTTQEKISWAISGADYLSGFDMIVSETELGDEALASAEPTYSDIHGLSKDLENLTPSTDYYVYLRAICKAEGHDEGNSDWASVHFKTLADCPAVINLSLELGATDSITATWERATMEQAKEFKYILTKTRLDVENITAELSDVNDTVKAFNELDHAQKYYFYVASACGDATSAFVEDSIETLPACQAVENLAVSRVEHNRVELAWTSAQLATETEWKVGIVGDPIPAQTVSERNALLFGLNAETAYEAYVIALCGEESVSDSAKVAFNTAAQPENCAQVGNGTSSDNMPVTNYNYAYTQMIYGADLIGQSGTITSLQLKRSTYANVMSNMKVYLGTTSKATFASSSDWVAAEDLTLVYEGSFPAGSSTAPDLELALSEPYVYNGSDNLVVAISNGHGNWNSIQKFYYTSAYNTVLYRRDDNDASYANHPGSAAGYGTSSYRTNIQFCFEPKAAPDVTALTISDITTESAKASWEPMGSEIAWNVFISPTQVTDFSGVVAERVETLSKSFTGLNDDEDYFVYVQPAVEGAEYSMVSFRTIASCLIQTNPAVVDSTITAHTARVIWVDPNAVKAGNYKVVYAKAAEFDLENADMAFVESADTFAVLPALQADTVYKFAVMANCGGDDDSRYSIAAQFTTPQSCFTPYATTVIDSTITAHSATVYWKDDHDDAGYLVAYGLYDSFDLDNPDTYLTKYVTDTIAVLEGLTAGESYKVSIKGDCSSVGEGQSKTWAPYAYFNTKCEAKALPYSEDFETQSSLVCWTVGNIQEERDSYGSYLSYDPGRASSAKANGEYGLKIHAYKSTGTYGTDADSAYAVLPELVFGEDAITDYQIRFNAKAKSGSGYYSHLLIGVAEDDALTNLEIIADTAISTSAFQEVELSFAAYAGTGNRIVLLARVDPNSTASFREAEIYVDDIYVSKISACKRPNALAVSNITTDAAQLAWTENGEATAWQIRLNGDDEHLIDADANPFNLSALTAATAYSVEVRANCGETQSEWSAPLNFATEICNEADKKTITFVLTDQYSDSWNGNSIKIIHKNTSVEVATITMSESGESLEGSVNLCCGDEYSFVWVTGNYPNECGYVFYDINGEEILSKTKGSTAPSAGEFFTYTMNCVVPTCIKPASVEAEVLSATSAQISWTAGGEETQFQYVCVLSGETPDWSGVEAVAATEVVIDTLQLDTDYDFYVRAYCSETEQSDYRMTSFHVGYCVPAPTSVDAQGITAVAFNGTEISAAAHSTSAPYYANNAHIELDVHADEADSLQITFATGYTYGTVIWVDWNNNLTFEASEVVYKGTSYATKPTTLNCVFYIPAATAEGIYRLRIGAADSFFDSYISGSSSEADPCANGTYKLYEDYSIKVVSQGPGTGIDAIESKNAAIKRLENDQVVIIRDGKKYTIMGVKIQ